MLRVITTTSHSAHKCHTGLLTHTLSCMSPQGYVMLVFNRNCASLHHCTLPLCRSHRPCQTFALVSFVVVILLRCCHVLFICVYYLAISVHPFIHSLHLHGPCVCFLFPPQRFIHPSEHPVLSIPFIGMIVIVAVVWCWLSELASQRVRYDRSLSLSDMWCYKRFWHSWRISSCKLQKYIYIFCALVVFNNANTIVLVGFAQVWKLLHQYKGNEFVSDSS